MPAALASMHHSGRSSAPEPMFVPGGGTSGPPPFQGMLGSMTIRPQQQRPQQPTRGGGTGRSPERDPLAAMLSGLPRSVAGALGPLRGAGQRSSAAGSAAGGSGTAAQAGRSSSNNASSSGSAGYQVPALAPAAAAAAAGTDPVSSTTTSAPPFVLRSQQAGVFPLAVSAWLWGQGLALQHVRNIMHTRAGTSENGWELLLLHSQLS